jgi:hypothetical protein
MSRPRAFLWTASALALLACVGCGSKLTPGGPDGGSQPPPTGGVDASAGDCADGGSCPSGQAKWDVTSWDKAVWN